MDEFDREEIKRLIDSGNHAMIIGMFRGRLRELESYERHIDGLFLDYLDRMGKVNNMIKKSIALKKSLGIIEPLPPISTVHKDIPAFPGMYSMLDED